MDMETGYSSCLDELQMLELFLAIKDGRYVNICPLGHERITIKALVCPDGLQVPTVTKD